MLKIAKLIPIIFLALLIQLLPITTAAGQSAGGKGISLTVNKSIWQIMPGETVMVEVEVQKQNPADKIELKIKTSPLSIRTVEDSIDADPMVHRAQVFVTAPMGLDADAYKLAISASNGTSKSKKSKLTFFVSDGEPTEGLFITSASYSEVDFLFFLGGLGFGSAPSVFVNGKDISATITSVQDTMIQMKGSSRADLGLQDGVNEIMVEVDGKLSNKFILNLFKPGEW
jgi:hypothetical protein